MAQIPLGNFGQITAAPVRSQRVSTQVEDNTSQILQQAVGRIGGAVTAAFEYDKEIKEMDAATEAIRYGSQLKELRSNLQQQYDEGLITYDQLDNAYSQGKQKLQRPSFEGHDPIFVKRMENALYADDVQSDDAWREVSTRAKKNALQVSTLAGFDEVMKQNIDNPQFITAWVDSPDMERKGRIAFGEEWALKKTALKEQAWQTSYFERITRAGDDVGALNAIASELQSDDGKMRLDAGRRMQMLQSLQGNIETLKVRAEARAINEANKQQFIAKQAYEQAEKHIAMGGIMSPEMLESVSQATRGTVYGAAVDTLVAEQKNIQTFLRMPADQRQSMLDDMDARYRKEGSSPEQLQHLERMRKLSDDRSAEYNADPHSAYEKDTGTDPQYVNLADTENLDTDVILGRVGARDSMIKRGDRDPGVLKAEEKQEFVKLLSTASNEQKAQVLADLNAKLGQKTFDLVMRDIYENDPVSAHSGMLYGAGNKQAATTVLRGAELLKDPNMKDALPSDDQFDKALYEQVGDSFAGAGEAYGKTRETIRAAYMAKAEQAGQFGKTVNPDIMSAAIAEVVGTVVEHNDHKVLAPHGMDEDTFLERAESAFTASGIGLDFDSVNLMPYDYGKYLVQKNGVIVKQNGRPVIIEVR